MKIEKEESVTLNTLSGKQTKFTIDEDGADFIIEALSKTIYKNPIGTLIREYVSNAYDANRENGVDDPVIVTIDRDASGDYLSVIDYGVGLSEDRINNIFCRYGKSTKRGDNDQIGGFGIGAKSGFAYTDTFFINTVHDNVLYNYVLYKTEKVPQIQLLSQEEVDQRNSTQVKIYIKSGDVSKFSNEIRLQLRYFDSVYVKSDSHYNDVVIVEKETFKYSNLTDSNNTFSKLHICLGKVAYPINFNLVGISSIDFPFALKFDIGDLPVTLSREELQYDNNTIQKIKDKIEIFKKEIEQIYLDENIFEYDNLFLRENFELTNPNIILNEKTFSISTLVKRKPSIYTKSRDYTFPINVSGLFESKGSVSTKSGEIPRGYNYNLSVNNLIQPDSNLVLMDVNRSSKEKTIYYFEEKGRFLPVYLKKRNYKWYKDNLRLNPHNRGFGKKGSYINLGNFKRIQDFNKILLEDFKLFGIKYSEIQVTVDYKKKIQAETKLKRDQEKEKQREFLESKKQRGEVSAYEVTPKNVGMKRLQATTINLNFTKYLKGQSKAYKNTFSAMKKIVYVELSRAEDIKQLIKSYPVLSVLYQFIIVDQNSLEILEGNPICIYLTKDFSSVFNDVKKNGSFINVQRIIYHVRNNSMWSILSSYDFKRNIKERDKEWFEKRFKKTIECIKSIDARENLKLYDMYSNFYTSSVELGEYIGFKKEYFMSYEDIIEINLSKKISHQLPLLKHVNFMNTIHVILHEMKRRGFMPGNSSYIIINKWEEELVKESEKKEKYLKEIKDEIIHI